MTAPNSASGTPVAHGGVGPLVSIVVVGYNDKSIATECLESLNTLDYRPLLVIYVDNDSRDGSLEHIGKTFPDVVAIASGANLGYCGGNNVGIKRALEAGAEYVLILNPDTVVCNRGFVTELVHYLQLHPEVGKVGPKVYLRQYGTVQNTILGWPSLLGSFVSYTRLLSGIIRSPKSVEVMVPTEVPSLNGCCLLVRKDAILEVGLYDSTFWCYMDEVDWDWQAQRAGWMRHYVPIESIIHLQKVTGYDFASRANFYMKRNTALWYAKTGKYVSMLFWMAITLLVAIGRTALSPFVRRSPTKYAAFVGKLALAYAEVMKNLLCGTLSGSHQSAATPSGLR